MPAMPPYCSQPSSIILLRFPETIIIKSTTCFIVYKILNIADLKILFLSFIINYSDRLLEKDEMCDSVGDDTEWNVFDIQSFLDLYQIS